VLSSFKKSRRSVLMLEVTFLNGIYLRVVTRAAA